MGDSDRRYVNNEYLLFRIKSYGFDQFFFYQMHILGFKKNLDDNIQPLFELLIDEIELNITQDTEKYSNINIYTHVH